MSGQARLSVGIDTGDIRGSDHRAIQAAVDYVANLGGGVVEVGPGRYTMRNALFLRDNVHVKGAPGKTVLAACDGAESALRLDGDCNERQVTLTDPSGFRVGDGISVQDQRMASGFGVTTATLTAQLGPDAFGISRPLYYDYMVSKGATARLVFPVVAGYRVKGASVEGVTVEGNRKRAQPLNGCRGGGIYLFECGAIEIRNCMVRDYNGDGISFQVSETVTVEDCVCEGNAGIGLHPGSGSTAPTVRGNRITGSGGDGIYVCWRVKHGVFENNRSEHNGKDGISVGHKDTDNVFRKNRFARNARHGVCIRDESEPMGAHRNVFEGNEILDNGGDGPDTIQVRIMGHTHDMVLRNNVIGRTKAAGGGVGVQAGPDVKGLRLEGNTFKNVRVESQP
ncbi:MAG: right-handed parallel beta-helix repeat-containing protein [Kiritimatiellae bacterium]|nr:right-handed parallel beta-helix repeat-containing protein [Kiritimatiellia bacterium]